MSLARDEFIDKGFQPILPSCTNEAAFYLDFWRLSGRGRPAPVLDETRKAAVWVGWHPAKTISEVPVLAMSMDKNRRIQSGYTGDLFIGALGIDMARQARSRLSIDVARLAIGSASHYAGSSVYDALELLQAFMPIVGSDWVEAAVVTAAGREFPA